MCRKVTLGKSSVGDVAQQASIAALTALVGKEAVELTLHAATAKATQGGYQCGQGQLARAGECQRRLNIDPPCRSKIDPGRVAEI
jgi:hypothetical protein